MPPDEDDPYSQAIALDKEIEALPPEERTAARRRKMDDPTIPERVRQALGDLYGSRSDIEPPRAWQPGDTCNGYILDSELGRGGGGEVWKASKPSEVEVIWFALKFTHEGADNLEQIRREVRLQEKAGAHPNVHPVYEAFRVGRHTAIVTKWVPGGSLADHLQKRNGEGMPVREVLKYVADVAKALKHNDHHNIVHRDIKPGNLLMHPDRLVVTDYGHARDWSLPHSERVGGTFVYSPPEYLAGHAKASKQNDLFGLGAVMAEMLTGRRTFDTPQFVPCPPPELPKSIPPYVRAIVSKLLAEKVEQRYPSAEALLRDLTAAQSELEKSEGAEDDGTDEALVAVTDRILRRPRISWPSLMGGERARAVTIGLVLVVATLATVGIRLADPLLHPEPRTAVVSVPIQATTYAYPNEPTFTPPENDSSLRNPIVTTLNAMISGCQVGALERHDATFADLHLSFTIERFGQVSHVNAWSTDPIPAEAVSCMRHATQTFPLFPHPAEGRTEVEASFNLFAPTYAPMPPPH